jgi:hypothetical protein
MRNLDDPMGLGYSCQHASSKASKNRDAGSIPVFRQQEPDPKRSCVVAYQLGGLGAASYPE